MKPPNPQVGPFRFTIVYDASLVDDDSYGQLRPSSLEIALRPSHPDVERESYNHELLHACCFVAGIKDGTKLDEEAWVSRISPIYLAALQGDVAEYLGG